LEALIRYTLYEIAPVSASHESTVLSDNGTALTLETLPIEHAHCIPTVNETGSETKPFISVPSSATPKILNV
jgi:hypothetical protein